MSRTRRAFSACLVATLLVAAPLRADTLSPLENAKELFRQGNELRKAGDCAHALALYLQSRRLVPSVANTTNAAICMTELHLDDEALDLYEELLLRFRAEISDDESNAIATAMTALRNKLGLVDVSANVQGLVVIDGRPRGRLPLPAPIYVGRGSHVVRVLEDGYEAFETTVAIEIGKTAVVDAKLVPLAHPGRLRVEVEEGADVIVDGAVIGRTPWEGTLSPGPHVLVARKGPRGTAPLGVVVVENQTVTASPALTTLGPPLRVVPDPLSARLAIDGVTVGAGEWRGPLPIGRHTFEAREEAYLPLQRVVDVTDGSVDPIAMRLDVDSAHPRWFAPPRGHLWVELWGAFGIGSGLGSGAEASCDRVACSNASAAKGGAIAIRAGYELPFRLSLQIDAGYIALRKTLDRAIGSTFGAPPVATTYALGETIDVGGPFAGAGLGYRVPVGSTFDLLGRLELGIALATASDATQGTITGGGRTLGLAIERSGSAVRGAAPFVLPAIAARAHTGRYYAGLGLAVAFFFVSGPALDTGDAAPSGFDCAGHPGAADCAPATTALRGQRAFGPTVVWLPTLELGATF